MKVIDDFLPSSEFEKLQSILMEDTFPWYYNDNLVYRGDKKYGFIHLFYNPRPELEHVEVSTYFSILNYTIQKLECKKIHRIKANLNPRTLLHDKGGYHIDGTGSTHTSILYMNTNNGWTHIKGYDRVKSVSNRMVIFDSNLKHTGVTCTNEKRRVMINFNYDF
tara:strand:- start:49 stop:540 length:492 start_codon:yes stop_codon:yes gene_type:complete